MDEVYRMTPAVKAQLAMLGLPAHQEAEIRIMLENEYWRGYMDGEHDVNHRDRGIQIGDGKYKR